MKVRALFLEWNSSMSYCTANKSQLHFSSYLLSSWTTLYINLTLVGGRDILAIGNEAMEIERKIFGLRVNSLYDVLIAQKSLTHHNVE